MSISISVIIPVYNLESYILKSLKSLKEQTFKEFEIIIVDDGSKDSSFKIIQNFKMASDLNIKLISQVNKGVSAARNLALDNASGKFIVFVDGDDYVRKDYLEQLYKEIKTTNSGFVYCGYKRVDESGKIIESYSDRYSYLSRNVSGVDLLKNYFTHKETLYCCTIIVRKDLLEKNNIRFSENIKYGEDLEFNLRILYNCEKVSFVAKDLYFYLQRESGVMGNAGNSIKYLDLLRVLYDFEKKIVEDGGDIEILFILQRYRIPMQIITILKNWALSKQQRMFKSLVKRRIIRGFLKRSISFQMLTSKVFFFSLMLLFTPNLFYRICNLTIVKIIKKYR